MVLLRFGVSGTSGMFFLTAIAGMVCTALSVSGQTITDLKTGYWLGSTPAVQQRVKFLGVAVAYFDGLLAEVNIELAEAQKAAVSEQLAQAKRNFEVGVATITDTNEAQARYDTIVAQEILARNNLDNKRTALRTIFATLPGARPILLSTQDLLIADLSIDDRETVDAILKAHGVALPLDITPVARWAMACPVSVVTRA